MTRSIYWSTTCLKNRTPDAILEAAQQFLPMGVECSVVRSDEAGAIRLVKLLKRMGIPVLLHNYFPPPNKPFLLNLASQNPEILNKSLSHCRRAIELSAQVEAPFYAVHAGYTFDLAPEFLGRPEYLETLSTDQFYDRPECLKRMAESIRVLWDFGVSQGVDLLVENHVLAGIGVETGKKLLLLWSNDEIVSMAKALDNRFYMLLDTGHLKVSANSTELEPIAFLKSISSWIRAFHLSDNSGKMDEHQAFDEKAWFLPELQNHKQCPVTLEFSKVDESAVAKAASILEK